ncbi:MAG: hypothetical protein M3Y28_03680, partial [Armatimonadota bacterium]|nr:hypothetical protein [Armatimonadota bacterium]
MADRQLRPLSLGDIFDEAFDLYKKNIAFFALVTAVAAVPLNVLVAFVTLHWMRDLNDAAAVMDNADPMRLFSWFGALAGRAALISPLFVIAYGLEICALAVATSARYLGEPMTLWAAYRGALRRFFPLALTALIYCAANALGLVLCYVGMLVPLTLFAFTAHTFMLEGKSYFKALGRSSGLMSGQAMRVFGALLLLSVVYGVMGVALRLPLAYGFDTLLRITPAAQGLLGAASGAAHGLSLRSQIVDHVTGGIIEIILMPFLLSFVTVLYYDLRIRREAFDIELLAR